MGHDGPLGAHLEEQLSRVETTELGFGGAVAVAQGGQLLGIAWTGEAAPGRPWTKTTPTVTWSVSKGVVAMVVAFLAQSGEIDPEAPIRDTWPEFGVGAARSLTLSDVMTHRAGLPWLPEADDLPSFAATEAWSRSGAIADALAEMALVEELRGQIAYHALTYGWLVGACVRRATGANLNAHLRRMLSGRDGIRMSFGTTDETILSQLTTPGVPQSGQEQAQAVDAALSDPENRLRRSLCVPVGMSFSDVLRRTEDPGFLAADTPAISLIADAGSLARTYSLFAAAGPKSFIATKARDRAIIPRADTSDDGVTGGARRMAIGFVLGSSPSIDLGPRPKAFGHPGMGGSLAWGDPETGLGFAYLTNAAVPDTVTDPRALALSHVASAMDGNDRSA